MFNFVSAAAIALIGAAIAQPASSVATPALDARTNSSCSLLQRWSCVAPTVSTKIGSAKGALEDGAARFVVKYANADRWKASSVANKWELPCVVKISHPIISDGVNGLSAGMVPQT